MVSFVSFLLAFSLLFSPGSVGKSIKVVDFKDFEKLLSKKNDTLYVINFWATWCSPCVEELPYFLAAHQKYSKNKFRLILVSLDFENQLNSRLLPFVHKNNISCEVLLLRQDRSHVWIPKVNKNWSGSIPATLFISNGKHTFHEGQLSKEQLTNYINKLKTW